MSIIPHQKRYLPHEIGTRIHAVTLYRSAKDIEFVCRRYKISKASLMRWNKRYDGTPESLADRSHRPHTVHPRAHTNEEIMWVLNLVRRNPDITPCELYGKLRRKHRYTRPPSLYTGSSCVLDCARSPYLRRRSVFLSLTIRQRPSARSGRWM